MTWSDRAKLRACLHQIAQALAYLGMSVLGVSLMVWGCVEGRYGAAYWGFIVQMLAGYLAKKDDLARLNKRIAVVERRLGISVAQHVVEK